ncbi:MAG: hypothetical protein ACP5HQ_06090 [Thermoprotei archaeon]
MDIERRFWRAFRLAVRELRRHFPEFALIGRFARNFYATPETTLDIDFIADLEDEERVTEFLRKVSVRYGVFPHEPGIGYKMLIEGIRVDLVKPPKCKYDREVQTRRRLVEIKGVGAVPVLAPENLAVLYLVSSLDRGVRDLIKAKDVVVYSEARGTSTRSTSLGSARRTGVKPLCLSLIP